MAEAKYVPFAEREEWADVAGIPQDDGPNPVVPIAYNDQFSDTMNYFRAMLHADERSKRAFDLTTEVIALNPANYTTWHFRRLCIDALGAGVDLQKELSWLSELALDYPKNYQIWYHRRCIVEKLGDSSHELEFTEEALEDDSKNYHAWAHRQWALKTFSLWQDELAFTDKLLNQDMRNNSAWNQRYFVLQNTTTMDLPIRQQEIQYAIKWINKAPNNPSPWNYLRGLTKELLHEVEEFCLAAIQKWPLCPHPYPVLIDIALDSTPSGAASVAQVTTAIEYCDKLATELDTVRRKYWLWRREMLEKRVAQLTTTPQ